MIARIVNFVRVLLARARCRFGLRTGLPRPFACEAFTTAFVALAAKMAVADGVPVDVEAQAFERMLGVSGRQAVQVRMLYDRATSDVAGYETYAERIGTMLDREPGLKQRVLECLLYVACSDGVLHPSEDAFLSTVAEKFGYTAVEFRSLRSLFVRDFDDPYEVLGVEPGASRAVVQQRYHELARELHPDLLIAAGAPPAVVRAAEAKLAAINDAYHAIRTAAASEVPA